MLRPREPRTLAILLRPQTHDLFARSRPGTPKKVMGPPEEGTLADLLAPEGRRRTLAVLLRIYARACFSSFAPKTATLATRTPPGGRGDFTCLDISHTYMIWGEPKVSYSKVRKLAANWHGWWSPGLKTRYMDLLGPCEPSQVCVETVRPWYSHRTPVASPAAGRPTKGDFG